MITAYVWNQSHMQSQHVAAANVPAEAIWIDLLNPTPEEVSSIESLCGIDVPTREEMVEIEVSSRLYSDDDADFMTASVVFGLDTGRPLFSPVTFMLVKQRLITLRYSEPKSFAIYSAKLCKGLPPANGNGNGNGNIHQPEMVPTEEGMTSAGAAPKDRAPKPDAILVGLLETIIDRVADLLESISADLDRIGDDIFSSSSRDKPTGTQDFKQLLRRIGAAGDLTSRVRESLATLDRLLPFLQLALDRRKATSKDAKPRVKAMARDIHSLNDFVSFLSNKTTFLLDTTVGMISIEQNAIIKIFSVAAVAFLPPTLIASIYGMNFQHIPELTWTYGYPYAIALMIVSAVLPMVYFRYKNWL